jgi:hypothetical protein
MLRTTSCWRPFPRSNATLRDGYIKLLQNLCADASKTVLPQSFDLHGGDLLLGTGIRVVGVDQNIRINEDFGGHAANLGLVCS